MSLFFVKKGSETPSGLTVRTLSSCYFMSDNFKKSVPKICTSPIETILCLDHKQSMYCQLLTGLLQRDHVVSISSIFGSVLARSIKFLQDHWNELCSNIRTGCLSDWITDPGCRNAVSSILTRPNPELADTIEHIYGNESWEGIIKKLWPKAKYINSVITGTMSQYISLLDFYGGGIPLVSPSCYGSLESTFGINLNPLSNPYDISYTFLPNMAYFEFLPVDKDGEEKAQESDFDDLYRYRVGEVLNLSNDGILLSIDMDKTSEADLLKAIGNAKRHLEPLGFVLMTFSSYAESSSIPGRYVLFWELKFKERNRCLKLDAKIMEQCCSIVEESLDFRYKSLREANKIAALELKVVKHGTFDAFMDFYVSKRAELRKL
ncbi:hypothetical protein GOBAR_DD36610 [Gossypium barbadense]|nr:hypothetical protein GOBAR_DD36610 [Gossypium barbadense]